MEYQRQQSPPVEPAKEETAGASKVDSKLLTDAEAASEEAAELVEKLEYFKVGIFQFETNQSSQFNYFRLLRRKCPP